VRWIQNRRKAVENWFGPLLFGFIEGLGAIAVITFIFWGLAESSGVSDPSANTFRDLSQVGAAMFVAFAVATAGASAFTGGDLKNHLNWLGATCGLGLSGFLAIGSSVALAAFREAGHAGWLDILGLCWVGSAVAFLGGTVAILPYAAFNWSRAAKSGP